MTSDKKTEIEGKILKTFFLKKSFNRILVSRIQWLYFLELLLLEWEIK